MSATTALFAQLYTIDIIFYRFIARNYHDSLDYITQSKISLDNYHKYLSKLNLNISKKEWDRTHCSTSFLTYVGCRLSFEWLYVRVSVYN